MGLQELGRASGVSVTDDSTDIRGWRALDGDGRTVGRVVELLFDPQENLVHYAVVDAGDRRVLWPVSRLGFDDRDRAVSLKGLRLKDLAGLEAYDGVESLTEPMPEPESTGARRMTLLEERLHVGKRPVKLGEVQISRHPVVEPASEDVTVYEEELEVERRKVDRPATGDEGIRTEGDVTIVPVVVERLVVEKRPFVVEEIVLTKRRRTHVEHVEDTVRRQEIYLNGEPLPDASRPSDEPPTPRRGE
jgi:uncharacterized protein (TIGR02271 family)